jgi:hypothetical protein
MIAADGNGIGTTKMRKRQKRQFFFSTSRTASSDFSAFSLFHAPDVP